MRLIDGDKVLTKIENSINLSVTGEENVKAVMMVLQNILNIIREEPEVKGE